MREWINCSGCEKVLQDNLGNEDDRILLETAIKAIHSDSYRDVEVYYCDKACQVRHIMQLEINKVSRELDELKGKIQNGSVYDED